MIFDSKIIKFILIGVVLFLIYRYTIKSKEKRKYKNNETDTENQLYYFKYNNNYDNKKKIIKPILKKKKSIHNRRVRFNLQQPFDIDYTNQDPELEQDQEQEQLDEELDHEQLDEELDQDQTTNLCQKMGVDLSESFNEKLNNIKGCNKNGTNPISLREIYDDIVVDYKKASVAKELAPIINKRKEAAFNLTSYDNSHWNYQNDNIINGGVIDTGLYANDPSLDLIARF